MKWQRKAGRLLASVLLGCAIQTATWSQTVVEPKLLDLSGKVTSLVAYKGKITFVNFWATWCAPCKLEMPEHNAYFGQIDKQHIAMVGIAADEPALVKAFVKKLGIQYPIATGEADRVFAWSAKLGNIDEALPFSMLLDETGKVRWTKSGAGLTSAELTKEIDKLLASTHKNSAPSVPATKVK